MANYHSLTDALQNRIRKDRKEHWENPYACRNEDIIRRYGDHDMDKLWRPAFVQDVEKILHNPYYNRYSDKTQVFSLYKNDDISRRALHVQLVSRIARNIGTTLNLNVDLIEAIALGHDIGHTPFGHAGERILNELYQERTGRMFNHNVHSVRVLDKLVQRNISLQVLDGVLCHNGEMELDEYRPKLVDTADSRAAFGALDARLEDCYTRKDANKEQIPCTLEGCVMRVSDIIAYLGKDRQDAKRLGMLSDYEGFQNAKIGTSNAEIINNMIVNIIENSYGKPYLAMSPEYFQAFRKAKKENYELIYQNPKVDAIYQNTIKPMFCQMYERLLWEMNQVKDSLLEKGFGAGTDNKQVIAYLDGCCGDLIIYKHHILYLQEVNEYKKSFSLQAYIREDANDIVVDYMASMTDDYFIDLYGYLFPESDCKIEYKGYFDFLG